MKARVWIPGERGGLKALFISEDENKLLKHTNELENNCGGKSYEVPLEYDEKFDGKKGFLELDAFDVPLKAYCTNYNQDHLFAEDFGYIEKI